MIQRKLCVTNNLHASVRRSSAINFRFLIWRKAWRISLAHFFFVLWCLTLVSPCYFHHFQAVYLIYRLYCQLYEKLLHYDVLIHLTLLVISSSSNNPQFIASPKLHSDIGHYEEHSSMTYISFHCPTYLLALCFRKIWIW